MLEAPETKKKISPMAGYCHCGSIISRDASLHLHWIASELTLRCSRESSSHQELHPSSDGRAPCGLLLLALLLLGPPVSLPSVLPCIYPAAVLRRSCRL